MDPQVDFSEPEKLAASSAPALEPFAAPIPKLPPPTPPLEIGRVTEIGRATWYKRSRHTHTTASGEALDDRLFTAAHRRLPFGSFVRVTDIGDGQSVIVRINDRGPFTKGFILDLSKAAAKALGVFEKRNLVVSLEVLAEAPRMHPAATEISNLPTGKAALAALMPSKAGTRQSATRDAPRAKAKIAPRQSKRAKSRPPPKNT